MWAKRARQDWLRPLRWTLGHRQNGAWQADSCPGPRACATASAAGPWEHGEVGHDSWVWHRESGLDVDNIMRFWLRAWNAEWIPGKGSPLCPWGEAEWAGGQRAESGHSGSKDMEQPQGSGRQDILQSGLWDMYGQ